MQSIQLRNDFERGSPKYKVQHLSKDDHFTLTKSTISSLPIYVMYSFLVIFYM